MDVTVALDELFAATREEFTALRDTWVRQARADEQRDVAEQLKHVRKPTVAAWLVNQVSRRHPDEVAQLIQIGEALREAHHALAGDQLRTLSRQRNELSQALTRHARSIAGEADQQFGDAASDQVESTWTAAAADPTVAETVRAGRLSVVPTPESEQDWLAAAVSTAPRPITSAPSRRAAAAPAAPSRDRPDRAALTRARHDLQQAKRSRDQAQRELEQAEREATEAVATTAGLREQLAELRDRLTEATEREHDSRQRGTDAGRAAKAAERAVRDAEQQVARLTDDQ